MAMLQITGNSISIDIIEDRMNVVSRFFLLVVHCVIFVLLFQGRFANITCPTFPRGEKTWTGK